MNGFSGISLLRCIRPMFSAYQRMLRGKASDLIWRIEKCSTTGDLPIMDKTVPNPYEKEKPKCLFCRFNIRPDYKNVRLLSQFVSSFTGRLYEQNITGLCEHQYTRLRRTIIISRKAGFMPVLNKQPRYFKDPRLFDPMKPIRPNRY